MTTAISVPSCECASAISLANRSTMGPLMTSSAAPLARASPEILRTTRFQGATARPSPAYHYLGKTHDLRLTECLGHRLLIILGVGLFQQHPTRARACTNPRACPR